MAVNGVLISGGTQPLGLALARRLVRLQQGPVLLVGVEAAEAVAVPHGALYRQVDLTRTREVQRLLGGPVRRHGISAVVNLAFHRDPHLGPKAHELNVEATRGLLQLAERHGTIRQFVHRSSADVYLQTNDQPDVIREDRPLNHAIDAPPWIRDRVEVDALVCARSGLTEHLSLCVLRCADIFAPDMGSQVYDYLSSRLCLRRMGFDPMLNLLSIEDAVHAFVLALDRAAVGPFNIPGADSLPLSRAIRAWGRSGLPVPSVVLGPAYRARHLLRGSKFQYQANRGRFHYNVSMDGTRAKAVLGYRPTHPIRWPRAPRVISPVRAVEAEFPPS